MTFSLDQLAIAYSDQLWLELSPKEQEEAWPKEQNYSHDAARWRAYLNRLCLNVLVPALQQETHKNRFQVWPYPAALPSIWEVVNGTAMTLGQTRIVIIPSVAIDTEEFRVPAEWVDIPSFVADYYLAVQVNHYDGWLRVWGFTTHQKLKHEGTYDPSDRTYSLESEDLFENLNVLSIAKELCPSKAEVQPLPKLTSTQAQSLLAKLGQPFAYSPRLLVGFAQWGALLEHGGWRQRLYRQRLGLPILVQLSQWLEKQFEASWQSVESVLSTQRAELALNFRGAETTEKRAKPIDLGSHMMTQSAVLVVEITSTPAGMEITVGVQPSNGQTYLPAQLQLVVLDEVGTAVMEAKANSANKNMQLQFSGEPGEEFSVKVTLGNVSVIEKFVI